MNSLKLLILLIVILFGIYLFQLRFQPRTAHKQNTSPTPTPKPTVTPSKQPTNTPGMTSFYTAPTAAPTIGQPGASGSYQYPGSTSQGNGVYTTSDSVQTVTQWYKDAISRDGFNSTTVVQTSTNGVTYNKLVAAKEGKQISIEIKKPADANIVTIIVTQ